MNALQHAAAMLLDEQPHDETMGAAQIERLTCEVRIGRESELVSLRLTEGALRAACTCGRDACAHVQAALQLVAASGRASDYASSRNSNRPPAAHVELRATSHGGPWLDRAGLLCEPLSDVVTAVVRAGVCSERIASVLETLARVERALPPPLPLGLLRWLGLMREALETQDVALAAQALRAAGALVADLRDVDPDPAARARVVSWLGADAAEDLERSSDRSMLEIAREWVSGSARLQIERRYLLDLESGEIFREESVRGLGMSSLGSCPRIVGVSLAEVERGCAPRRLRLLQYTTTPQIDRASWEALAGFCQRDSDALAEAYSGLLSQFGALAEPLVLVTPRAYEPGPAPSLSLEHGAPLPLTAEDEPLVLKHFEHICAARLPLWVAGRLCQRAGRLMLRPLAALTHEAGAMQHQRL